MRRIFLSLLALAGIALPANACGFYGSSSAFVVAQPFVAFQAYQPYAFAPAVAYAQPAVAYAQPAVAYAPVQAAVVVPEVAYASVQSYGLAQAVEVLQTNYSVSAFQAVEFLRVHGHAEAVLFHGDAAQIVAGAGVPGAGKAAVGKTKRRRRKK